MATAKDINVVKIEDKFNPVLKSPVYHKIKSIIKKLDDSGITKGFNGNCIASCDLMQNILNQHGIESKIIEVQLSIIRTGEQTDYLFVGFDNVSFPGEIDTHTVLIVNTEQPLLLDLSLANVLPEFNPYVIEIVNSTDPNLIAEYKIENMTLTYQPKKTIRLPGIHQKSLMGRMMEEQRLNDNFRTIKWITIVGLALGIFNFGFNTILLVLKMMFP